MKAAWSVRIGATLLNIIQISQNSSNSGNWWKIFINTICHHLMLLNFKYSQHIRLIMSDRWFIFKLIQIKHWDSYFMGKFNTNVYQMQCNGIFRLFRTNEYCMHKYFVGCIILTGLDSANSIQSVALSTYLIALKNDSFLMNHLSLSLPDRMATPFLCDKE